MFRGTRKNTTAPPMTTTATADQDPCRESTRVLVCWLCGIGGSGCRCRCRTARRTCCSGVCLGQLEVVRAVDRMAVFGDDPERDRVLAGLSESVEIDGHVAALDHRLGSTPLRAVRIDHLQGGEIGLDVLIERQRHLVRGCADLRTVGGITTGQGRMRRSRSRTQCGDSDDGSCGQAAACKP